jgi:anti-sigma regulatory factor (Ser/Thr protein kinase)
VSPPLVLRLPRTSAAPGLARRGLSEWLAVEPDGVGLDDAKLLVSELVTNAVVHGRGRIELRAHLDNSLLSVRIVDEGDGIAPGIRAREGDGTGGRGLRIVEAVASRWGIRQGAGEAWFELDRNQPRTPGGP